MNTTKIFVSSTCFDLEQIREDLRKGITEMGHEPVLSELPSFSVLPDLDTLSNCKRNVKENCDIFILIIGGKRGSIDSMSQKSIINIEFETAIKNNKDLFVFVDERVYNLLEVWRKNEDTDFSPIVGDKFVFEFIDSIKSTNRWIFPYKKADNILEVLKHQLSIFMKYLIERKNSGKLDPLQEFVNESELAKSLALEKPDYWEYKLTIELLRTRIKQVEKKFSELDNGLFFTKLIRPTASDYFKLVSLRFGDLRNLVQFMTKIIENEFEKSWGLPGVSGDPNVIKDVADKFYTGCISAFDIELEIRSFDPPEECQDLNNTLKGIGRTIFDSVKELPNKLEAPFLSENPQKGVHKIDMEFTVPANMSKIKDEINKLSNHLRLFD